MNRQQIIYRHLADPAFKHADEENAQILTTRYKIIALAILLCAVALLYVADSKSLLPPAPQSISLSQVK